MTPILVLVAFACLAVMTGNELCVAIFVNPLLRRLPEPAQVPFLAPSATRLGRVMPFWYAASLLLTVAVAYMCRPWAVLNLPMWSAALQAAVIVLTLTLLVPINNSLGKLKPGDIGWTSAAVRWDHLHQLRVALLIIALMLLAGPLALALSIYPFR